MSSRFESLAAVAMLAAGLAASGCNGKLNVASTMPPPGDPTPDAGTTVPFEPVPASVYVAKVKNLMLGLPASDDEVAAVTADPTALRGLADAWFVRPEAQAKLSTFFAKAFQQTQISQNDFLDQLGVPTVASLPVFSQAQESISRTALRGIADGTSFAQTLTTHTFLMTPSLMSLYLALDEIQIDDAGKVSFSFPMPDGTLSTTQTFWITYRPPVDPSATPVVANPIPLSETLDPSSPNFMHFAAPAAFTCSMPQLDATGHVMVDDKGAAVKATVTYTQRKYTNVGAAFLGLFGFAGRNFVVDPNDPNGPPSLTVPSDVTADKKPLYNYNCGTEVSFTPPSLTADDLVWRPVTVRAPQTGERLTGFYNLPVLRTANELVVRTPRVGFFSTPAFFANWPTNNSNQQRDTLNQALIVGIGRSINPVDKGTSTVLDTGKDGQHSDPTSPCYSCHQTMDPMRNVFRQAYTYSYHAQHDPAQLYSTAAFDYLGQKKALASLDDLGDALVSHPLFATAWAQKLCYYANSTACSEDDPEFTRVVQAFTASNYDFHTLVVELFSSPLVTGQAATKTWRDLGETVSIARQDHLCAALTNRLGLAASVCTGISDKTTSTAVANNIPLDGYLRGAEAPALSTSATPFYRGASEALCNYVAGLTIDKTNSRYSSAKKDAAITDFVANIMGLAASDPLTATMTQLLSEHYGAAMGAGASATDALKSTFVTACLSPTSVAIGL
jgi:hypothetical protein